MTGGPMLKNTFGNQHPPKRVENTKSPILIFDPNTILSLPYISYQVIESKKVKVLTRVCNKLSNDIFNKNECKFCPGQPIWHFE